MYGLNTRFCLWYCFNYLSQLQYRDKWGPAPCCALYQDHKPDSLRWSRKTAGCLGPQSLSFATLDCDQLGNFSWRMRSMRRIEGYWCNGRNVRIGCTKFEKRTGSPSILQVYRKSASCFQGATTLSHALGGKQLCVLGQIQQKCDSARKKHTIVTLLNVVKLFILGHSKTLCHPKGLVHSLARRIASFAALQVVVNLTMAADRWLEWVVSSKVPEQE